MTARQQHGCPAGGECSQGEICDTRGCLRLDPPLVGGGSQSTPTEADRQALARCFECFEDGQDTDVGRPMLDRLTALGWLDKIGRARWQISDEGEAVLAEMAHAV